jgi:membrane protease YdiL (CAAX protease family)
LKKISFPMNKGYWEQPGKNPVVGALIYIFLIGAIYFTLQAFVLNIYIMVDMALNSSKRVFQGNYFQRLSSLYGFYQRPILLMLMASQFLIFLLPSIWFYRRWQNKQWIERFQLNHVSWQGIVFAIAGTILFLPLADLLSTIFYKLFPGLEKLSSLQLPLFEGATPGRLFLLIVVIGLTPAICEEILFRGYLQSALSQRFKGVKIILISGLIFAFYHQNPLGLLALTAAGLWLGLLAWRFKSIYSSMTAHFVYNSSIILMVNHKIKGPFLNEQGSFKVWYMVVSTLLFALVVWWVWNHREDVANEKT